MTDQQLKIAVFIDFDNVEIGVKTTLGLHFDVGAVLEAIKERGEIITKVAYGDWKRAGDHGRAMAQHAVRLVQRVMTPGGDKNGADINLALDALEMAFTHDHINAFVIVGGDSDFITLVEKLKQYDKKVFVVGGRAFTSQVMQKNCTEFLAYENVARAPAQAKTAERGRSGGPAAPLDQALPLVKRALKVLADREVTPQLGLLKSTLLQLDSSFSERDYGASTFRDFAEKLAERGLVSLKHAGRSTLVEAVETNGGGRATGQAAESDAREVAPPREPSPTVSAADGVEMVRRVLFEAPSPPKWPLYLRQMKQFLRTGQPDFDERKYGSIVDLMRACQKENIVRLERDRQGGLRVFAGSAAYRPASGAPAGWVPPDDQEVQAMEEAAAASLAAVDAAAAVASLREEAEDGRATGEGMATSADPFEPQPVAEKPKRTRRPSSRRSAKSSAVAADSPGPTATADPPAKRARKASTRRAGKR
jgi:uncharacterized LabA/DUF88 family protein